MACVREAHSHVILFEKPDWLKDLVSYFGSSLPVIHISALGFEPESEPLHAGEWCSEVQRHNHCLQTLDGQRVVDHLFSCLH